jgi:hypothetical protein
MIFVFSVWQARGQQGDFLFENAYSHGLTQSITAAPAVMAATANPAATGNIKQWFICIGAAQPYFLKNIYNGNFQAGFRLAPGHTMSIGANYSGNTVYQESQLNASYTIQLAKGSFLGLRLHGVSVTAPEAERIYSGTFTLGFQTLISSQLSIGASLFNPIGLFRENKNNDLGNSVRVGIAYMPADYLSFFLQGNLENEYPVNFSGGVSYTINKKLNLYLSAKTNPALFGIGIGYLLNNSRIDLSATQHFQLGLTPALSFLYEK